MFPPAEIFGHFEKESVAVVVVEHGEHMLRVFIKIIESEAVVDGVKSGEAGALCLEGIASEHHGGEIHHGGEVGVDAGCVQAATFLPEGGAGSFAIPTFAHDVVVGVFVKHCGEPFAHSFGVGIRMSVHADTVDAGIFNPPY